MLLLDTHVAIWAMHRLQNLGSETQRRIRDSPDVHFSSVTIAEVAIKRMLGRLDVPADLNVILRNQGLRCLVLSDEHARALEHLPELSGHDPFDRLLVAQALVEKCSFVTADRKLLGLGLEWILDARL